jgi:hypothetical protein
MKTSRRSFTAGTVAALLSTTSAHALLFSGAGSAPPPPSSNIQTVSYNNLSPTNSYAAPQASHVLTFADGDVPGTGSVTCKDSVNSTVAVQMDSVATWPSGFMRQAAITVPLSETYARQAIFTATVSGTVMTVSAILNGGSISVGQSVNGPYGLTTATTIASFGTGAGGTGTYNLSASSSIASASTFSATTSKNYVFTPSATTRNTTLPGGWGGTPNSLAPDIKCVYAGGDAGSNVYTVSLRTILANYSNYPWGITYPLGGWEYTKSGPNCLEWHAWQYLINDSTTTPHGYIRCDMWVKALSPTGPYEIDVRTSSPNMWNTITTGSEQYNQTLKRFAANLTIKNGSTVVSNQGGAGDTRTVTFANTVFEVSTKRLISTNVLRETGFYLTSSGTLPAGLNSSTIYFLAPIQGDGFVSPYLVTERKFLSDLAGLSSIPAWAPNTLYTQGYGVASNDGGVIYYCVTSGTSASSGGPTGEGTAITDGTAVWQNMTPKFTTQGSGTITATPIYSVFPNSAWVTSDANGDPIWVGSGTRPQIFPGHDFNYLTQQSKAILPYNAGAFSQITNQFAAAITPNNNGDGLIWYQDTTGDGPGDQRVGMMDNYGVVSLYSPTDPFYTRKSLQSALGYNQASNSYMFDERNGMPFTGNGGPNRNGSVPYTNFPTPQPNWMIYNIAGVNPKTFGVGNWAPWSSAFRDIAGYGGQGYSDTSHTPCPAQAPYLKTARSVFMDQLIGLAMYAVVPSYNDAPLTGGVQYFCANVDGAQPRGWAWSLRSLGMALFFARDGHPLRACLEDFYSDSFNYVKLLLQGLPAQAQVFGTFPTAYRGLDGESPWQYAYMDQAVSLEKWRGGLTTAAVPGINWIFNYMDTNWAKYGGNVPGSLYYVGVYDEKFATNGADLSTCYTTALAVFNATHAADATVAAPYPSTGGIYDGFGAGYVMTNPKLSTAYPLIIVCGLKMRALADPSNTARVTMLSQVSTQIANKTGGSILQGGGVWSYLDANSVMQNYQVYSCF